ncbi:hypothetical protein O181_133599 [Austropuccinia psidii MF-1]|uniref:Uncharacterized protein n=1 Tax=Austropuccinia psidii MF-1 TaxID=1389203 RepID=A0A9Q3QD37_9BASI|nr:hypothetical protein [Austropuccinia psidii MF-1]
MTARRVFQYSIQLDGGELRGRNDPKKGKRKGKILSGTEFTQGDAISQRQVPEVPVISKPELEPTISSSNRDNHIQRHKMDIYMRQYKQYYMVHKDKNWEILPQAHQGVINSWHILKKFFKEEEIVKYYNGWNPLSSKSKIKKIKY